MTRLAAYLGPIIPLERFLMAPPNGPMNQVMAPRTPSDIRTEAGGFGIGWFGPDGAPERYRNPRPIWSDPNLPALARNLRSDLWLSRIGASQPAPYAEAGIQPFCDQELLFLHAGSIQDFRRSMRPTLLRELPVDIEAEIRGGSDSEYLFALLRQILAEDDEMAIESAIGETLALIGDWAGETCALLNLIVSDGERIYAVRHSINADSPELFYCVDDECFPDGAQLVASEALSEQGLWQPLPEHSLLILDPETPPELIAL